MDYDVIIAGGSFAGLAAAAQLRGKRVLLIEPNPIGAVRTSACATLQAVLEATGTLDSLLQVHARFVLHLPHGTYNIPLPDPFCTFDYRVFCRHLLAQTDAEVLRAAVRGHKGHLVYTTRGSFDAQLLIDATGWRAALATNGQRQTKLPRGRSFGLETSVSLPEDGLHFWYQPQRLGAKRVTWMFPIDGRSRVGLASYVGETRLNNGLNEWLRSNLGRSPNGIHGGYFPYRRGPAATSHVFRVGDAAGQCFALTGEGIRPALYFGAVVGQQARAVVEGHVTEAQALASYRRCHRSHSQPYAYLLCMQKLLTNIPVAGVETLAGFLEREHLFPPFMRLYRRMMEPFAAATPDARTARIPLQVAEEASA